MGTRFLTSKKKVWDPRKEEPPVNDGSWETCVVHVRDYDSVKMTYDWLNSGKHPFRSCTLDSISEVQQRAMDSLVGVDQMKTQDWGTLLRDVSQLVRKFRDLAAHPTKPLESVMMIAMTHQTDDMWRPYVQGALAARLPYYVDVCGYMFVDRDDNGFEHRKLLVAQHPQFEAGERVGGVLGQVVENPNISTMIDTVFGPLPAAA